MRNSLLLVAAGLVTISALGCGDASSAGGLQRNRGPQRALAEGTDPEDDNSIPDQEDDPANPNATTPPPAPATPGTSAGQLGVTLSTATPAADLGTTVDVTVTIEPKTGITGSAALTVTGLPPGATAAFAPASVTLGTTPVTSKMTITVPLTAAPTPLDGVAAIVVKAAAGTVQATANANFKINPKITMTIPVNSQAMLAAGGTKFVDGWGSPMFGTAPAPLKTQTGNGITVVVKNADSAPRTVHGNGAFLHGANAVAPGGTDSRVRVLNPGATGDGYLHGETNNVGTSVAFRISVVAVP